MLYRDFGSTGFKVSALGMGCMRLPYVGGSPDGENAVDLEKSFGIIRRAVDLGINYFDTALGYHGRRSEAILGEALDGGYRKKFGYPRSSPSAR